MATQFEYLLRYFSIASVIANLQHTASFSRGQSFSSPLLIES